MFKLSVTMRVLIIPHMYQSRSVNAMSSFTEVIDMMEWWISENDDVHVTWLMPDSENHYWEKDDVLGNHSQVDTVEVRRFMEGTPYKRIFGTSERELEAVRQLKEEKHRYFDIVLAQQSHAIFSWYTYLHELYNYKYTKARPFYLIKHVRDYYADNYKEGVEGNWYPRSAMLRGEMYTLTYSDSIWVDSPWDRDTMLDLAPKFMSYSEAQALTDRSMALGCPMDFDNYRRTYANEPSYIHVAGISKPIKHLDDVFDIAKTVYERYGVESIRTAIEEIRDDRYIEESWVEDYAEASKGKYLESLARGDICIVCAEGETGGRTFFEQAASGQVMIFKDEPWVYDMVPRDYPLIASGKKELKKMTLWAVENWDQAVAASKEMMDTVEENYNIDVIAEKTYDDMKGLADQRLESNSGWDEEVLRDTLESMDSDVYHVTEINEKSAEFTDSGAPVLDIHTYAYTDFVVTLQQLGCRDTHETEVRFEVPEVVE